MSCLSCVTLSLICGYAEFSLDLGTLGRESRIGSMLEEAHIHSFDEVLKIVKYFKKKRGYCECE